MLRTCRLLLAKGAFYNIRKSEISFVLRIIKRNYKLKFSLRAWGSGPQREDQDLSLAWLLCCCCVIMFLLGESSRSELTFLVVVVPRGPGNQDPRERIRTSLQPGELMDSWKGGRGLPPLRAWGSGSPREDEDLSLAWLLCCCVIMFSFGESSLSELTFLVVVVPKGPGIVLFSLFQ